MKKLTKYLSLILAVILSLTSLSGAVAEEIGDQITFAYYVNDGLLCQLGVEGESTRPATKIVAQLDQATVYYWMAPAEGETAGRLYVDSFLSSNSEPTLISDQVYGEPVYVQKDSKIYFLDASDSRLLKAVQVAPYQFNIAAGDVATLPFADTTLSDSLEGLHVEREIAAGLYVNRIFDPATGTLVSSTLDPEAEYHLFGTFETQQKDGSGLQLRAEASETWRLLSDKLADCQAAYGRDLYYGVYDETTGQTTVYSYNVDTMQIAALAVVPAMVERMVAYGNVVAMLSDTGVLRLVDKTTGVVTERGDYSQVTLPNDTAAVTQFDLSLAGNYVLVYGLRADNGLSEVLEMVELPAVKTMSSYLLPALFGSMTLGLFASTSAGNKVVKGGVKGVLPVIVIVSLVSLAARIFKMGSALLGMVGFLILLMLPVAIITSRILWKKGVIKVVDKA